MNPFDILNSVTFNKEVIITEENEKEYDSYMVNKGLSYYADTIMFANYMNCRYDLPKLLQYDFYHGIIPRKKRWSKWHKKEKLENLDIVCEYYKVGKNRGEEYLKILTQDQIDNLKKRMDKGGKA